MRSLTMITQKEMKNTYITPACKVRTMRTEPFMANTIIGDALNGFDMGWGGQDEDEDQGIDINKIDLWADEE